eukprot:CAMPEP_0174829416 /NCGR_PEP_ID=MMETSP1114-20130205/1918_1 /TAXON_ID=312471 /ORGANISM="Neobodo designis, Strain CCAP 1951/1" /LENGTH=156 /DNA_ID=CAMNT_0016063163 /DNA_START=78 /DNA_END=545 /DNA_ORIENTATION=+
MSQTSTAADDGAFLDFFSKWDPTVEPEAMPERKRNELADAAEKMWRTAVRAPPPANTPTAVAAAASVNLGRGAMLHRNLQVEIGRTKLTEAERWKLQAALRREAPGAKEYNKKLLRSTVMTKGPVAGEGSRRAVAARSGSGRARFVVVPSKAVCGA